MVEKEQNIAELRDKFLKKLEEEATSDLQLHPADINRVKTSDQWLDRFIEHNENNIQASFKMLWETCQWRQSFGVNEITENNVKTEYLTDGFLDSYGEDKDGKKLFILKCKLHTKGSKDFAELQRCIVYWFERLERERNGDQISLFFDMVDAKYSNFDVDLTKYLINLFQYYYPNFLNLIIILDMQWVLNAAFKMIKQLLPEKAKPKIKSVNKTSLKEFVQPSIALKSWGGENDYIFSFIPEAQSTSISNGILDNRKVHFAGSSPLIEQPVTGFGGHSKMLIMEPDILIFSKSGNEVSGTITLINASAEKNLAYKIKTTSPKKFKVRPNNGILLASQKLTVTIELQSRYALQSLKNFDKFQIMYIPTEESEMSSQELANFWKANAAIAEQDSICPNGNKELGGSLYLKSSIDYSISAGSNCSTNTLFSKISQIEEQYEKLQNDMKIVKVLSLLSIVFIVAFYLSWLIFSLDIKNSVHNQNNIKTQINHDIIEDTVSEYSEL